MKQYENQSLRFFDHRFRDKIAAADFSLSTAQQLALPHLRGTVLDLGCGLGGLSLAAAERGCRVLALDGCPRATAHLREEAAARGLPICVVEVDLADYDIEGPFDSVAAIGILMFFGKERALELMEEVVGAVKPGGVLALTLLMEGTTYMDMFEPGAFHLFRRKDLDRALSGWEVLETMREVKPAPHATVKVFLTLIARRPLPSAP